MQCSVSIAKLFSTTEVLDNLKHACVVDMDMWLHSNLHAILLAGVNNIHNIVLSLSQHAALSLTIYNAACALVHNVSMLPSN